MTFGNKTTFGRACGVKKFPFSKEVNMNKTKSILKLAISIALTFTFSCSGGGDDSGTSSPSSGGNNKCNNIANCKKKQIGNQVWLAENLNIDVSGSQCYDCDEYGRLYTWAMAMDIDEKYNNGAEAM